MSDEKTEVAAGSGYAGPACSALPLGLSREDAIEALWETVKQAEDAQRRDDPSFLRWPDLDALIEHIEAHGFPPPNNVDIWAEGIGHIGDAIARAAIAVFVIIDVWALAELGRLKGWL